MVTKSKIIQAQYQGYLHTPLLWENKLFGLKQFKFSNDEETVFNEFIPENLRLGKCVERFVSSELQQNKAIKVLLENVQVLSF